MIISSGSSRIDLALQELRRRAGSITVVRKVRNGNCKSTNAHEIASCAVHLQVVGWVAIDATIILSILGVTEKYDALDLVADGIGKLGDGSGNDSGSLTAWDVSTWRISDKGVMEAYLYPPLTIGVSGHFSFACWNSPTASLMAAWDVPPGSAFDARSAEYGPPTPCTQTLSAPYFCSRALATAGPVEAP